RYLDLLQGDADVALRSGDTDEALVGRKVADSVWGIYASTPYIEKHGQPTSVEEINQHAVISFPESMSEHRLMRWLKEFAPKATVASRASSILGLVQAAKSGLGLAPLPVIIAEEAGLVKVLGPIGELGRTWKLLTHPGLRDTPRVSAFFDFIAAERDAIRGVLG